MRRDRTQCEQHGRIEENPGPCNRMHPPYDLARGLSSVDCYPSGSPVTTDCCSEVRSYLVSADTGLLDTCAQSEVTMPQRT